MLRSFALGLALSDLAYCQSASQDLADALKARVAAHASLRYLSYGSTNLRERARGSRSGTVVDVVHFDSAVDTRPDPTNLHEWIASKKCDADLVVHGVIARGLSSLTTDENAVFTEFEVDVADTLYIKPGHQPRVPVVIIKPGGSMKLPEAWSQP